MGSNGLEDGAIADKLGPNSILTNPTWIDGIESTDFIPSLKEAIGEEKFKIFDDLFNSTNSNHQTFLIIFLDAVNDFMLWYSKPDDEFSILKPELNRLLKLAFYLAVRKSRIKNGILEVNTVISREFAFSLYHISGAIDLKRYKSTSQSSR